MACAKSSYKQKTSLHSFPGLPHYTTLCLPFGPPRCIALRFLPGLPHYTTLRLPFGLPRCIALRFLPGLPRYILLLFA